MALTNNPIHSFQVEGQLDLNKSFKHSFTLKIDQSRLEFWGKNWQIAIKDISYITSETTNDKYNSAFFNIKSNFVTGYNFKGNLQSSAIGRFLVTFSKTKGSINQELRYIPIVWFFCNSTSQELIFEFENYPEITRVPLNNIPTINFIMTFVFNASTNESTNR